MAGRPFSWMESGYSSSFPVRSGRFHGQSGALVYLGASFYAASGPAIHLLHERVGPAIGSFVLRALPMAGLVAIAATGNEMTPRDGCGAATGVHSDTCSSDTLDPLPAAGAVRILGLGLVGVGVILASVIDAGALAAEPVAPNASTPRRHLRLTPSASATASGGMLALTGTF